MGFWISKLEKLCGNFGEHPPKILMLGLDGAGKTTILYKMKLNETVGTNPTINFNVEGIESVNHVRFTVWDPGGQHKIRPLWRHFLFGCQGLIYVVDSVDSERFTEAQEELSRILEADELKGVPLLVLANKQDLPNANSPSDVALKLDLPQLKDRKWYVQGTSAVTASGVHEAMAELNRLTKKFRNSYH